VYTTTVDSFTSAVSAYRTFGKPIMVTEFSCNVRCSLGICTCNKSKSFRAQDYSGKNQQCDSGQIWSFLTGVMGWMDGQSDIAAYFFFGASSDSIPVCARMLTAASAAPMTASELEANNINGANALINSDAQSLTSLGQFYIGSS
jgi:hypothetical protein